MFIMKNQIKILLSIISSAIWPELRANSANAVKKIEIPINNYEHSRVKIK
jgi:hypothetical protein